MQDLRQMLLRMPIQASGSWTTRVQFSDAAAAVFAAPRYRTQPEARGSIRSQRMAMARPECRVRTRISAASPQGASAL